MAKQLGTGNTAGINPQKEMYSAKLATEITILVLRPKERSSIKTISQLQPTKYIPESNDFQR